MNQENLIDKIMLDLSDKIVMQKFEVLKRRSKELLNIDIDLEEEKKRDVKRFYRKYIHNEEIYYFKDGNLETRIVTFVEVNSPINKGYNDFKTDFYIETEIFYY